MPTFIDAPVRRSRFWNHTATRDDLAAALREALFELEILPPDEEAAVLTLHAILDDLEGAIHEIRRKAKDEG
jgi:hypothetical protein